MIDVVIFFGGSFLPKLKCNGLHWLDHLAVDVTFFQADI